MFVPLHISAHIVPYKRFVRRVIPLDHTDILFLAKTFPRLVNGDILLETDTTGDGDYFFDIVDIAADEDIFEEFF